MLQILTMPKYILYGFITFLFLSFSLRGEKIVNGQYHKVKALRGDGIEILLQRYELNSDKRLKNIFLQLNHLKPKSPLYRHKQYILPVKLFKYNGISIRSTIKDNDWQKAIRIKKYNENLLNKGVRKTHYTDSQILWVPVIELLENSAFKIEHTPQKVALKDISKKKKVSQPASHHFAHNDIYGSHNQLSKTIDQSLKGKIYYIVSGHGGPDPGATCSQCVQKLCEDEYAYDVSLRLARNLEQHGAIVEMVIQDKNDGIRDGRYLPCDKDERLATGQKIPINQMDRLVQRTQYINRKYRHYKNLGMKDQVVVSIHVDANSQSTKQDVFFCYYGKSKKSKILAGQIRDTFTQKYRKHQRNRNYSGYLHERKIYILRKTDPPAVLIELANINNPYNHKRIKSRENRQALANWIFEGLTKNIRQEKLDQIIASS